MTNPWFTDYAAAASETMYGTVMVKSIPESTVDIWTGHALLSAFPNAGLWAPTSSSARWDQEVDPGSGKAFLLECKAPEYLPTVDELIIDTAQLGMYLGGAVAGTPLFYVLPEMPWSWAPGYTPRPVPPALKADAPPTGESPSPFPTQARPTPTYDTWAYVLDMTDLWKVIKSLDAAADAVVDAARLRTMAEIAAGPALLPAGQPLNRAARAAARATASGYPSPSKRLRWRVTMPTLQAAALACGVRLRTLKAFIAEIHDCTLLTQRPFADDPQRIEGLTRFKARHLLAVTVPAEDLQTNPH